MNKNKKFILIAVGALVVTLAFGLVAFTPINTASAAGTQGDGFNHGRGPAGFPPGGPEGDEALAEALGISLEELQAAQEAVQAAALEQAVADGKLTQEQADQIAERGFLGRRGRNAQPGTDNGALLAEALGISLEELQAARESVQAAAVEQALADGKITEEQVEMMEARQALQNYMPKDEMVAKALGITVEELEAAKDNDQRLPDLMDELGIDAEDFEANMQTLREEFLQQAVDDGVITQEQADQMAENDYHGRRAPGGKRFPGGKEGFERPDGLPGRPGKGQTDGTSFQGPEQPADQG